jgi:hypothetical protein
MLATRALSDKISLTGCCEEFHELLFASSFALHALRPLTLRTGKRLQEAESAAGSEF